MVYGPNMLIIYFILPMQGSTLDVRILRLRMSYSVFDIKSRSPCWKGQPAVILFPFKLG